MNGATKSLRVEKIHVISIGSSSHFAGTANSKGASKNF